MKKYKFISFSYRKDALFVRITVIHGSRKCHICGIPERRRRLADQYDDSLASLGISTTVDAFRVE